VTDSELTGAEPAPSAERGVRARVVGTATHGYRPEVPVSPTTSPAGPALALLEAAIGRGPTPERLGTSTKRGIPWAINGPRGPEYPLSSAYLPRAAVRVAERLCKALDFELKDLPQEVDRQTGTIALPD
jgi:hypothetical protein